MLRSVTSHYQEKLGATALAFDSVSNRLAIGVSDGSIRVFDTDANEESALIETGSYCIKSLSWSSEGSFLVSVGLDCQVAIWDTTTFTQLGAPITHPPSTTVCLTKGRDDEEFISTWNEDGNSGTLRIWNLHSRRCVQEIATRGGSIESVALSPSRNAIAVGSSDGMISCFSLAKATFPVNPAADGGYVRAAAISPSRESLATVSCDGLKIWSTMTGDLEATFKRDWREWAPWSMHVSYSPDQKHLLLITGFKIHLLLSKDLSICWSVTNAQRDIVRCRFSADSKFILTDDGGGPGKWDDNGIGTKVLKVSDGTVVCESKTSGLEAESRLRDYERGLPGDEAKKSTSCLWGADPVRSRLNSGTWFLLQLSSR